MIKLQNITKVFQTEEFDTTALNGINLEVKQGEFVAIMGPSGCGKSTLLNVLGLIDTPTEGKYLLNVSGNPDAAPVDVSTLSESERTDLRKGFMGFVFQSFNLIDDLNVSENVELPLLYMGIPKAERKQLVLDVLRSVNMSQRAKHLPSQLSGGQQQRVAIARAIVGLKGSRSFVPDGTAVVGLQGSRSFVPDGTADVGLKGSRSFVPDGIAVGLNQEGGGRGSLLLADEPTGNLDSKNGLEIMELLSKLNEQGTTIVMVTHSQHDATYADRIINLYDGQVVDNVDGLM